jgi:hypothetical protein
MADTQTLTIEITTGHCLGGEGNDVYPGQVLVAPRDLPLAEARKKVRMGYARVVTDDEAAAPGATAAPGPAVVTHGDPAAESRDPITQPSEGRRSRSKAGGR